MRRAPSPWVMIIPINVSRYFMTLAVMVLPSASVALTM